MAAPSCSADGLFASSASAEADMISFRSLLAADLQNYTDRMPLHSHQQCSRRENL